MNLIVIILVFLFGVLLAFGFWVNKKFSDLASGQKPSDELLEIIKMLQTGSKEDRKALVNSLQRNTEALNLRLDNAAKVISQVQKNIGEMSEIGRSMRDLQEFLRSPKLRGNIGEQVLRELLEQFLPKQSFHLQYAFKSGEKVDAVIKTTAGIIPIDSKFPMENFRAMISSKSESKTKTFKKQFERDVKVHIQSISKKYIISDEGTIDYALMYIPSEAVYYEIVNNPALFEYSFAQRVLPVSPTTFYAYLRSILMSFEGQKIESKAKEILQTLRAIQKDYSKVEDNLTVLQKHLNNASNMMGNVLTSYAKLGQKIPTIHSLGESLKKTKKLEN